MRCALVLSALVLAGCAALKNTPAQERAISHFNACMEANPGLAVTLGRVTETGPSFSGRPGHVRTMKDCLSDRFGYRYH